MSIDDELRQILDNAPIAFGLKNQGHLPTIERMLDEAWERIGKEIGWCPKTAREHYERIARNEARREWERDIEVRLDQAAELLHSQRSLSTMSVEIMRRVMNIGFNADSERRRAFTEKREA